MITVRLTITMITMMNYDNKKEETEEEEESNDDDD